MNPGHLSLNADKRNWDAINAIRFLSIDAVQKANSGHPGAPMGMAPAAFVLWRNFLKHNPRNPQWINRDRFILSAGHASMLIYSLLHLSGYDLSIDDIKQFRQLHSRTPGHPEYGLTPGVETTTGPLGQGLANAVGMALAEKLSAHDYNEPANELINHYTYVLASDGDMEEGIGSEAASLAGTWRLNKLICIYDDNNVSIDSKAELHLREDVAMRFRAYGWNTAGPVDGNDLDGIASALAQAQSSEKPTLISVKSTIGFGSPNKADSPAAHGAPLGEEEVALTRKALNWEFGPFEVPDTVREWMSSIGERGAAAEAAWNAAAQSYQKSFPSKWQQLNNDLRKHLPADLKPFFEDLRRTSAQDAVATRVASGNVLNKVTELLPRLVGGSADLAGSNNTLVKHRTPFQFDNVAGRNLYFGIREHGMGGIANGMALHGEFIPYAATFLIFSDYMRNAIRMSAINELQVVWILTHDSIGLGEDGPTHQPISQLMGLRMIPGLLVMRPADASETASAWETALRNPHRPSALILTRQKTYPALPKDVTPSYNDFSRGGYIVRDSAAKPDIIIIATGSELHLALESSEKLTGEGAAVRVVSLPCWELFSEQSKEYRDSVLPPNVTRRISIEAGTTIGWERYVGLDGIAIGIDQFGASAPAGDLFRHFGFTVDNVVAKAHKLLPVK